MPSPAGDHPVTPSSPGGRRLTNNTVLAVRSGMNRKEGKEAGRAGGCT